jgi:hypothetical protein
VPLLEVPEMRISERPDRLIMLVPGLPGASAHTIANRAVNNARKLAPKLTGRMSSRLVPQYGKGYFGISWLDCLVPGTRVLRADWRWVPVENLLPGDSLIAFDEEINSDDPAMRGRGRRYRTADVEVADEARRECVEIIFDDGFTITCTKTHPWLTLRTDGHPRRWVHSAKLRSGDQVGVYLEPWEEDDSYEGGWLAGLYDGEGNFTFNNWKGHPEWTNSGGLNLAQNPGPVLDKAMRILEGRGFSVLLQSKSNSNCKNILLKGGFPEQARLLGSIRPERLLSKLRHENRYMRAIYDRKVVAVREVGWKSIILLSTSTGTYLAEGMPSHNSYTWFQEQGINPFTMTSLAGKTIPMWINDPYGTLAQANPKALTRVTVSGVPQVLIFRKAAPLGSYKTVRRRVAKGQYEEIQVPRSYPGAPGRIGVREAGRPWTSQGRIGGAIARGNVGVRWRHPGLAPRLFLNHAITMAATAAGIVPQRIYIADRTWRSRFALR